MASSAAHALRDLLASGALRTASGQMGSRLAARAAADWSVEWFAGRFVELGGASCSAALTAAALLVGDAQRRREPCAWIGERAAGFFPPDLAAAGVDLDALPVVHVADGEAALRAADGLLRSGAFGLLVLDLVTMPAGGRVPMSAQVRLTGLARQHGTAIVALTGAEDFLLRTRRPRAGGGEARFAMASVRATARRERVGGVGVQCVVEVEKDKRRGQPWSRSWSCAPPPGMEGA
jgi:recombination protein RecA